MNLGSMLYLAAGYGLYYVANVPQGQELFRKCCGVAFKQAGFAEKLLWDTVNKQLTKEKTDALQRTDLEVGQGNSGCE